MGKVFSDTIEDVITNRQYEGSFSCDRGTETITINDEMLTTFEVTKKRAEAEFLTQSYIEKAVTVMTYHIDGINIGDLVEVDGVVYFITGITDNLDGVKATMQITARRYE
jgi:hypothetical protein